jgi:transcription elongation GreA/GreB family factor
MAIKTPITRKAVDGVQKTVDSLLTQLKSIQDSLNVAGDTGDRWHDEAFKIGLGDQQTFQSQLQRIQLQLSQCELVKPEEQDQVIKIGNLVKILINGKITYLILDGLASYNGACSFASPIGNILYKKKVGDKVNLEINRRKTEGEVLEIVAPAKVDKYIDDNKLFLQE